MQRGACLNVLNMGTNRHLSPRSGHVMTEALLICFCVCFVSCVRSMTCLASSNSRCLMPNVSRTSMCDFLLGSSYYNVHVLLFFYLSVWTDEFERDSILLPLPPSLCLLISHGVPLSLSASSKTISGLLEFDSKTEAVEVLTVLNHYQIRIPSKTPPVLQAFI